MRLLLTGAGGFIGHHMLQHVLVNTDWDVVATDSFRHKGKTDRISQVLDGHPEWVRRVDVLTHDLSVPFSEQMIHRIGFVDYIIAMASESHVFRSIEDPVPFVRNNVDVMLSTLELARLVQPRTFLHVSTDEIYGPVHVGQVPHPEWDPVVPSSPYSASKVAQEAVAISYWRSYGVPLIITNLMNIYGERQDKEKFLPMLISRIFNGEEVQIHGTAGDIGSRHYLHARNASSAWLFLLQNTVPSRFPDAFFPDRYNIGSDFPVSNLALAEEVASVLDMDLYYKLVDFHHARPGHDPHYGLDMGKITGLGWKPPVEFHESLARTVRWTVDHPEWI